MDVGRHSSFEGLLEDWDGETAVIRLDRDSGSWFFVCLHSTRLGPAGGGTRMKIYGTPAEALEDAMRLSAAMTRKLAVAGLPFGGGKAVLAVPVTVRTGSGTVPGAGTAVNPYTGSVVQPSAPGVAVDPRTGGVLHETPSGYVDPRSGRFIPK